MDLIDEILESNDKILKNNAELIAVNKEWSKLTKQLLDMLMEERRKRANGGKSDCTIHMTLQRPEKGEQDG